MATSENRCRLMIVSLGGSPKPIALSLATYRPESVVFFASHDSIRMSAEVLGSLDYKPRVENEITENPNFLLECYRIARRCIDRADRAGFVPSEILVDYTGGTKVMTAALLLASVDKRFRFNYVGGNQRDKDGIGVVLDGHEHLFAEMSPWVIFAEEERRQVVTLFNCRRYSAVIEIIDSLMENELPYEIESYFKFVRQFSDALLKWDQFDLKKALELLGQGLKLLSEYLKAFPSSGLEEFYRKFCLLRSRLQSVLSGTKNLAEPHQVLVADLLNNARRKIADKRNDDAAARIYRALELYGQICFRRAFGCGNDKVEPSLIPEDLREEFVTKYKDQDTGQLKLPLQATFRVLEHTGHEAGARFFDQLEQIKKVQTNRNDSILAHGLTPVSDRAVQSIFKTVSEFLQFSDCYDFPQMP